MISPAECQKVIEAFLALAEVKILLLAEMDIDAGELNK